MLRSLLTGISYPLLIHTSGAESGRYYKMKSGGSAGKIKVSPYIIGILSIKEFKSNTKRQHR